MNIEYYVSIHLADVNSRDSQMRDSSFNEIPCEWPMVWCVCAGLYVPVGVIARDRARPSDLNGIYHFVVNGWSAMIIYLVLSLR